MKPTFNNVTKSRYNPYVAVVYGTDKYIQFKKFFKSMKTASACAAKFHGMIVPV